MCLSGTVELTGLCRQPVKRCAEQIVGLSVCVTVDHMTCEAVSREDVNDSCSLVCGGGHRCATSIWINRGNLINAVLKLIKSIKLKLTVSFIQF